MVGGGSQQDYETIVQQCKQNKTLFEDPEFAADDSSLFDECLQRTTKWMRPTEMVDNPMWISKGATRFDINQGMLSDFWVLSAVASLTCNETLFKSVVDHDQSFKENYCGVFRFTLWHEGEWKKVVVDDRLPTYNSKLIFMHSNDRSEFWSALLEKAFAKLHGGYEGLKAGCLSEAMTAFTGGVTETFDLEKAPSNLHRMMLKTMGRNTLMGCVIKSKSAKEIQRKLPNGLIKGCDYSITKVSVVNIKNSRHQGEIPMVRVCNPCSNEREWTGAWSDKSPEWGLISEDEKVQLGLTFNEDGEFWMSFEDWKKNFEELIICNLGPDSIQEQTKKSWHSFTEHGQWVRGHSAGGCRSFINSFASNPQYHITLTDPDDDDDEKMCSFVIALMQKGRRKNDQQNLVIGYAVYKAWNTYDGPLDQKFFAYHGSEVTSETFINSKEIVGRYELEPGTYIVVPSTFKPNEEGEFMIRIFTEKPNDSRKLDHKTSFIKDEGQSAADKTDMKLSEKFKRVFDSVAGWDNAIDADELKNILNSAFKSDHESFDIEISRSLVAMFDKDMTGKIGFDEYLEVLLDLKNWMNHFKRGDVDRSKDLDAYEIRDTLKRCGYKLSNSSLLMVNTRFIDKDNKIDFQSFVLCVTRLKTMMNKYMALNDSQKAVFSIDDFLAIGLYC